MTGGLLIIQQQEIWFPFHGWAFQHSLLLKGKR